MIEIGLNRVRKNFGFKNVLSGASLEIHTGERAALVGRNGTGKSTILKLIAGEETPDSGVVSLRRGARRGVLWQIPPLREPGTTVEEALKEPFSELFAMERRMRELEPRLGGDEKLLQEYSALSERYALEGGYEMEERSSKVIGGFRLSPLLSREYNALSGGQKTVVNLAAAVLPGPDILLLDEPTNHLDMETLEWFEDFLSKYRGTVVLVSHDRWFLDRVATRTILLEGGCCESFPGGYSKAMELREKELLEEFQQYKTQQKKIEAMKASIKRFREWGALNKNNPSFYRKAKELEKRLEKLELLERPQLEKPKLPISFEGSRTGSEVLRLRDFSLTLGDKALFRGAELLVRERDRLCLMGPNGSGKTSLIRALLGELPYGGEIRLNPSVQLGYIPQEIRFLPETETVLEAFRREIPSGEGQARGLLAKYFFRAGDVFRRADSLSGGEKVLLKLLILLQRQVNLLILDEPTNHIDVETREMLEEALSEYRGTLLFVSHDRYFIHKTATRAVYVRGGRIETAGV